MHFSGRPYRKRRWVRSSGWRPQVLRRPRALEHTVPGLRCLVSGTLQEETMREQRVRGRDDS